MTNKEDDLRFAYLMDDDAENAYIYSQLYRMVFSYNIYENFNFMNIKEFFRQFDGQVIEVKVCRAGYNTCILGIPDIKTFKRNVKIDNILSDGK